MTTICRSCVQPIPELAKFCPNCGVLVPAAAPSNNILKVGPTRHFGKIQDAIDHAPTDAIIEIDPGIYHESLHIDKGVTLLGTGEPKDTRVISTNAPALLVEETASVKAERLFFRSVGWVPIEMPYSITINGHLEEGVAGGVNLNTITNSGGQLRMFECFVGEATLAVDQSLDDALTTPTTIASFEDENTSRKPSLILENTDVEGKLVASTGTLKISGGEVQSITSILFDYDTNTYVIGDNSAKVELEEVTLSEAEVTFGTFKRCRFSSGGISTNGHVFLSNCSFSDYEAGKQIPFPQKGIGSVRGPVQYFKFTTYEILTAYPDYLRSSDHILCDLPCQFLDIQHKKGGGQSKQQLTGRFVLTNHELKFLTESEGVWWRHLVWLSSKYILEVDNSGIFGQHTKQVTIKAGAKKDDTTELIFTFSSVAEAEKAARYITGWRALI